MKRFLLNVLVFFGVIGLISSLVVTFAFPKIRLYTKPFDGYLARCQSLTNSCLRPRLVLVGGSNLACGIDNHLLSELLDNKYELVNLGFHAGLGIGVHFDMIFNSLRAGDVVVLAAEYSNYGERWSGGLPAVVFRCDVLGRNLFVSTFHDRWSSADCGLWRQYALEKCRKIVGGVQLFSEPTGHSERVAGKATEVFDRPDPDYVKCPVFNAGEYRMDSQSLDYISELAVEFKLRGIVFLISAPALDKRHFALHPEIAELYEKIEAVPEVHVISRPVDYAFPLEEMLDTEWHVNLIGREKRTRRLAGEIRNFLVLSQCWGLNR